MHVECKMSIIYIDSASPRSLQIMSRIRQRIKQSSSISHPSISKQPFPSATAPNILYFYHSLVYMAEHFRVHQPPQIHMTVHCLKSILQLTLPSAYLARTHLQIARLLISFTPQHATKIACTALPNDDVLKSHLERAVLLGMNLSPEDDIAMEAVDLLVDFFARRKRYEELFVNLNQGVQVSLKRPYWHCRFLFRLAQAQVNQRDPESALDTLAVGDFYTQEQDAHYTNLLFKLARCFLYLSTQQIPEFSSSMRTVEQHMEHTRLEMSPFQIESLNTMALLLKVAHLVIEGHGASARDTLLPQLQQSVAVLMSLEYFDLTALPEVSHFSWFSMEEMRLLSQLISGQVYIQCGALEQANASVESALEPMFSSVPSRRSVVVSLVQLGILELAVSLRLMSGQTALSLQHVQQLIRATTAFGESQGLVTRRKPDFEFSSDKENQREALQPLSAPTPAGATMWIGLKKRVHCLLGLVALHLGCFEEALCQLQHTTKLLSSSHDPVNVLLRIHEALAYLELGKWDTSWNCVQSVSNYSSCVPVGLAAAFLLVRGLCLAVRGSDSTTIGDLSEAREYLQDCIHRSQELGLDRVRAWASAALGYVYLRMGEHQEARKSLDLAWDMSCLLAERSVQMWVSGLMLDMCSEGEEEHRRWTQKHETLVQGASQERHLALRTPEMCCLTWRED